MMKFGSVCSGIEAASVAWRPLGWEAAWLAEIEPFCCALLKHHYPQVRNYGDFTEIKDCEPIDLLVGGTPCQSFSVAGKRGGLDDARGNLTLEFLALAGRLRPRWVVWENVPGVLSDDKGRTFGTVLGILGQLGYGFAFRILDAQHFGIPQRRRRVFVVGYLGDWRRAAAVLFERACLSGNSAPSREAREDIARCVATGTNSQRYDWETETFAISGRAEYKNGLGTLRAQGGDLQGGSEMLVAQQLHAHHPRANVDENFVPIVAFQSKGDGSDYNETSPTMRAGAPNGGRGHGAVKNLAVALPLGARVDRGGSHREAEGNNLVASPITSGYAKGAAVNDGRKGSPQNLILGMGVRRLTPEECEALQGFSRGYTKIPYRGKQAADGPRYRALGNSMAIPVVRWLGRRIQAVEDLTNGTTT